jgi:hypothetical protein
VDYVPPVIPTPPPAPRRRTPVVTAAGGMLITAGVLTLLAGLIIVLAGSDVLVDGKPVGDAARTIAILAVALGVADVIVGVLVLQLVPLARILGFGFAALTVLIGLISVVQGSTRSLLQMLLGGFTIWALVVAEPAFRRDDRR